MLHIGVYPMNLPLGNGVDFKGVWDRRTRLAHLFERTPGGAYRAPVSTVGLDDPLIRATVSESVFRTIHEELEIIEHAGAALDPGAISRGEITPVFFGSAVNNFGIQLLLDGFIEFAPQPRPRMAGDVSVKPGDPFFSGFIFKIQANMDPRHRDRMAFIRIVSGKFTRDMAVIHVRSGKKVRLSYTNNVFGRDRVSADEAFPGDVIGITGYDFFAIGDTLSENSAIRYSEIPRFPPECFAYIHNPVPAYYKRFRDGIEQLAQEGLVHLFELTAASQKTLVMGAVGPLQFDLVGYRLESEYGAQARIEKASWTVARWITGGYEAVAHQRLPFSTALARDRDGRDLLLFEGEWHCRYFLENFAQVSLAEAPLQPSPLVQGS